MFRMKRPLIISFIILSACSTQPKVNTLEYEQIRNELYASVTEPTLDRIKLVIQTDLQFERGCRERNIEINVCDFKNSLDVEFVEFTCKEGVEQPSPIPDFRKYDAICDYRANLTWPDGKSDTVDVQSERYEFGMVYSNELFVEHGWKKVLSKD